MKALVDTNVVLDVLLARTDFLDDSRKVMSLMESGQVLGCVCATTVTTLFYLIRKQKGIPVAKDAIADLRSFLDVAAVDAAVIDGTVSSDFTDFEDAVVYKAAKAAAVDVIVTRNVKDFLASDTLVLDPGSFLSYLVQEN